MWVADLETDGLLPEVTRIHILAMKNVETGEVLVYRHNDREDSICMGLEFLEETTGRGELVAFHNGIGYDLRVIQKLYPQWRINQASTVDTLVLARAFWPEIKKHDFRRKALGKMPGNLIGRHSLEAWGYRLGCHKAGYAGGWEQWSQEMEDYCLQDLEVTEALLRRLMKHSSWGQLVCEVEQKTEAILLRQTERGVEFDEAGAASLYSRIAAEREEVRRQLREVFPPFYLPDGQSTFVPRRDHAKLGYVQGAPLRKVKLVEFNPGSRNHIALMLKRRHGWQPTEFTDTGEPKLDDEVIGALPYPEAKLLARFLLLEKRAGQIAEGDEAWLKHVKGGVIHGRVTSVGTVTGRMSHQKPNLAQVPKVGSPFGEECRALFRARPGWVWVGCDADALELRVMAHFMARYDGGAYIKTVLEGDKSQGTDMHTLNMRALGITSRDTAKTWFYAWLYGGGAEKLGLILTGKHGQAKKGQAAKTAFLRALPALGQLVGLVQSTAKTKGRLRGMDGRVIPCRSAHSAVNALFQSAGAVAMKVALVILDEKLQSLGLLPGRDYEFVLNVHDEWQIETKEEHVETISREAPAAIAAAGEKLGFRCPLAGNAQVGRTWAETH